MATKIRIGALISGGGTNLQAIIDACAAGRIAGDVVFVGSDRPGALGLQRAAQHGIPTFLVDYGAIIRQYREQPDTLTLPADFDLEDLKQKQHVFGAGVDIQKVRGFSSRAPWPKRVCWLKWRRLTPICWCWPVLCGISAPISSIASTLTRTSRAS
jgi:hypothetical protein